MPGRATHWSGVRAKRIACSVSERYALLMSSATRAAASMRSNAMATSGRIGLPCGDASGQLEHRRP